jgi:hypothetical protein
MKRKWTYLEYTPGDTTHGFAKREDRQGRGENGDEYRYSHPCHEKHHGGTTAKVVLSIHVDDKTGKLPNNGGVGQAGLPCSRNEVMFSGRVIDSESLLKLALAVEGCYLENGNWSQQSSGEAEGTVSVVVRLTMTKS